MRNKFESSLGKLKNCLKFVCNIFGESSFSCDCGDIECKRAFKSTNEGKLYVINHFTCGKVKKIINDYKDVKF
jgi:hypothetical protein